MLQALREGVEDREGLLALRLRHATAEQFIHAPQDVEAGSERDAIDQEHAAGSWIIRIRHAAHQALRLQPSHSGRHCRGPNPQAPGKLSLTDAPGAAADLSDEAESAHADAEIRQLVGETALEGHEQGPETD